MVVWGGRDAEGAAHSKRGGGAVQCLWLCRVVVREPAGEDGGSVALEHLPVRLSRR